MKFIHILYISRVEERNSLLYGVYQLFLQYEIIHNKHGSKCYIYIMTCKQIESVLNVILIRIIDAGIKICLYIL